MHDYVMGQEEKSLAPSHCMPNRESEEGQRFEGNPLSAVPEILE